MGVLPCNRNGCGNIMCDYYSHTYGYICHECYNELLGKAGSLSIDMFMNSYKNDEWDSCKQDYIREEFKSRFEEED